MGTIGAPCPPSARSMARKSLTTLMHVEACMPVRVDQLYLVLQLIVVYESIDLLPQVMAILGMEQLVFQGGQAGCSRQLLPPIGGIWVAGSLHETKFPFAGTSLLTACAALEMHVGDIQSIEGGATHQTNDFVNHTGKNRQLPAAS